MSGDVKWMGQRGMAIWGKDVAAVLIVANNGGAAGDVA